VISEGHLVPVETAVLTLDALDALEVPRRDGRTWLVLVKGHLDDAKAAWLEDAGIGYVDSGSRAWLPGQPPTRTARTIGKARPRLGTASLRLAQLLADHPREGWSERLLAARGRSTPVTAHHLFRRLEEKGHIKRTGSGRSSKRWVVDAAAFRRWLASEGRPQRTRVVNCFVRDPERVTNGVHGDRFTLTGVAAAELYEIPVTTARQQPLVRVAMGPKELELVPRELGGFRTDRGSNLTLIADPGGLGSNDARERSGVLVSPPSRVMLDLHLEPRGEAAADVFLDLWGDRDL
jgi:hypothetical protein